jgi:hypothetical protein
LWIPTENFTQLELPGVKFSLGLSEHLFHAQKLDSTEKFVPIPLPNDDKAKYSCADLLERGAWRGKILSPAVMGVPDARLYTGGDSQYIITSSFIAHKLAAFSIHLNK